MNISKLNSAFNAQRTQTKKNKQEPSFNSYIIKSQPYVDSIIDGPPKFYYLGGKVIKFIDSLKIYDKKRDLGEALRDYFLVQDLGIEKGFITSLRKNKNGIIANAQPYNLEFKRGQLLPYWTITKNIDNSKNKIRQEINISASAQKIIQDIIYVPDKELPEKIIAERTFNKYWQNNLY